MGVVLDDGVRRGGGPPGAAEPTDGRYRTLFTHAPDAILIISPDNYILDANPSCCRMVGYSHAELVGAVASKIVAPHALPEVPDALREILASVEHEREWDLRRKDGSIFPAEVIATLLPDGNLLALMRDRSERRRAEQALREANESLEAKVAQRTRELHLAVERAEAADRMKSAFLATMSHELRTPLNSIIGFTALVLGGMAGSITIDQQTHLATVRRSAQHLLELINDILDISKIEANRLELHLASFDLRGSIESVLGMVSPLAQAKGLALEHAIAPEVATMVGDRRRVEQIALNLVTNAIKFTERGRVTVSATIAGSAACLRVTDTGIGIATADLPTLFQPFRQLETGLARRVEGTGLGLAICHRLVALLDGEIAVTSREGHGSEFTVTLPLAGPARP